MNALFGDIFSGFVCVFVNSLVSGLIILNENECFYCSISIKCAGGSHCSPLTFNAKLI
jgi:hypothetical protein